MYKWGICNPCCGSPGYDTVRYNVADGDIDWRRDCNDGFSLSGPEQGAARIGFDPVNELVASMGKPYAFNGVNVERRLGKVFDTAGNLQQNLDTPNHEDYADVGASSGCKGCCLTEDYAFAWLNLTDDLFRWTLSDGSVDRYSIWDAAPDTPDTGDLHTDGSSVYAYISIGGSPPEFEVKRIEFDGSVTWTQNINTAISSSTAAVLSLALNASILYALIHDSGTYYFVPIDKATGTVSSPISIGTTRAFTFRNMGIDGSNNLLLCGTTAPIPSSSNFVIKRNSAGTLQWSITFDTSATIAPLLVRGDQLTDDLAVVYSSSNEWRIKLLSGADGSVIWDSDTYGTSGRDIKDCTFDNDSNVYACGLQANAS